jgi:enamine deaminase RidA (YjgF/YER057c/UK114 family)
LKFHFPLGNKHGHASESWHPDNLKSTMTNTVIANLKAKGFNLPTLQESKSLFKPVVISGIHAYVSGQLPSGFGDIKEHMGKVGKDFNLEQGKKIAQICALNVIAQLQAALGDLEKVKKCVKLTVFVNTTEDFDGVHLVANGASEMIIAALGDEKGAHARSAVGLAQLPFGVAVEIEAVFEV